MGKNPKGELNIWTHIRAKRGHAQHVAKDLLEEPVPGDITINYIKDRLTSFDRWSTSLSG